MMQALQSKCNLLSFEVVRQHQTTLDSGAELNTHTHTHTHIHTQLWKTYT